MIRAGATRDTRRMGVRVFVALAAIAIATLPVTAHAVDAGGDASFDAGAEAATSDPAVVALAGKARAVVALTQQTLDVAIAPPSLFDVPLDDERAINLEAARLAALLRDVDKNGAGEARPSRTGEAGAPTDAALPAIGVALWRARLDLDRARFAFYSLSSERRRAVLDAHAKRQLDAKPPATASELHEQAADAERDRAKKAALEAHSEAERLVSGEYARLLEVERAQAAFEKDLTARRQGIATRQEATLGWQRRAREARDKKADVDRFYDDLRAELRAARSLLGEALGEISAGTSTAPIVGTDALAELPPTIDATDARAARARVDETRARLDAEERRVREARASQLLGEIDSLNRERLAMLPFLSATKRDAVTGFGESGVDQAASEVRQLVLIVRYHRHATSDWLSSVFSRPAQSLRANAAGGSLAIVEWLVALGLFVWFRRRVPIVLERGSQRAIADDRVERRATPGVATRAFGFALDVHRPIEWLVLALVMSWLLPTAAKGLLEVQLLTVMVQWILGGALVVDVVNAFAGRDHAHVAREREEDTAALRLKSLRLVGRVVVTFGLVLALGTKLVGEGTIYQWVLSTCWIASVPVALLLVRWWRETVFKRADRARKKSPFERWVLENQTGWKSFFAASAGVVYLFVRGAVRGVRGWVGRFGVTRRVLAYLFRRRLDKLSAERTELETAPLPAAAFDALGPDTPSASWITTDIDEQLDALAARLKNRKGGVIAVVGQRGQGKSALLRRLHAMFPDTVMASVPAAGADALRARLAVDLGVAPDASLDAVATALDSSERGRAILLDDVHRFIQPVMGGLARFDDLLAVASRHCARTTWILALDDVIWLFLQRARGARPLFDEVIRLVPWREEQIIELLNARTESVGVAPTFERLLDKLPPNADEIDKREALELRAANYYRLLWDYATGNPGVALHMWRRSLGVDATGATHVRFFQAPDTADLERLPDPAIFVLRAVLQLAPAEPDEIARATMLSAADVADALRYAHARGYVKTDEGRYTVTWAWFRPIVIFLQRRHLLVLQ